MDGPFESSDGGGMDGWMGGWVDGIPLLSALAAGGKSERISEIRIGPRWPCGGDFFPLVIRLFALCLDFGGLCLLCEPVEYLLSGWVVENEGAARTDER